jgi:O-antigen/teichoic acid export membrane protein
MMFVIIFIAWLIAAVIVLLTQGIILEKWKLGDASGLYVALPVVLLSLWQPVFWGVLQGQQNILWLGWSMLSNGVGRLGIAVIAVLVLHIYATGMVAGVLIGLVLSFVISVWHTRSIWRLPTEPFDWRGLLRQIVPLILGFLGFQILFTADTLFVKTYFSPAETDFYLSAGTMSRALMWLVLPLATVMFPRLVHSAARAEKTNLMGLVLIGTAVLSIVGAASLSLLGPFIVGIVYDKSYVAVVATVLPWYAFAMVPLAVGNVLLNNLLARPVIPKLFPIAVLLVAIGYMIGLTQFHASLTAVLQVLGVSNLLFLAVCAWFTWGRRGVVQG